MQTRGKDLSRLREQLRSPKGKAALVALCVVCAALLIVSEWTPSQTQSTAAETAVDPETYARHMEERLTTLIREIRGAGKTQVLVTLRADGETVWARNDQLEQEQGESERLRSTQEYVLLRSGSAESGLRVRTGMPAVQGVAVVCAGANDPEVCARITQTITAALGIAAAHVSVVQMQP